MVPRIEQFGLRVEKNETMDVFFRRVSKLSGILWHEIVLVYMISSKNTRIIAQQD